jgi:hypothetical protein
MAGMPLIALCVRALLCILVADCNSGWQQVVHACQQLLPGKMIVGAPTPAIPKPGPQGPGFSLWMIHRGHNASFLDALTGVRIKPTLLMG